MNRSRTIRNAVLSMVIVAAIVTVTFTGLASRCVDMIAETAVDILGIETKAVSITTGDVVVDELPAKVDIEAYGIKRNGNITDHVKWRLLSEDGEEAPIGIIPLASPEYGKLTVYITEPGIYIVEASSGNLEDTIKIEGLCSAE